MLSDITLKKVIVMVLLLMFLVPLFDTENYVDRPNDWDYITVNIENMLVDSSTFSISEVNNFITNRINAYSGNK